MSLIVQKFGGTSVKDAERIQNVARIVTETYQEGNDDSAEDLLFFAVVPEQ